MRGYIFRWTFSLILLWGVHASLSSQPNSELCLQFISPIQGIFVSSNACTLEIVSLCDTIRRVEYQVRYIPFDGDSAVIDTLGTISESPFQLIWDISKIPNQLLNGASMLAEATMSSGEKEVLQMDGIFLTHQPVAYPKNKVTYQYSGFRKFTKDTILFQSPRPTLNAYGSIYWNENELVAHFKVNDAFFHKKLPKETMKQLGLEILIDPSMLRHPYPDKGNLVYVIPLEGIPYRIQYTPYFNDNGEFVLASSSAGCNFEYDLQMEDLKGFDIIFRIPSDVFGEEIPQSFNCNFIIKTVDEYSNVLRVAWVEGNVYETYSPYIWGTMELEPKPIQKKGWAQWVFFFFVGFGATFAGYFGHRFVRNYQLKLLKAKSEEERYEFETLKLAIEKKVILKDFNLEEAAHDTHITSVRINNILKRYAGMPFHDYLMFCRIEIAKERLRSSHLGEDVIAETTGFANKAEMEKFFLKFHHITPYKFRVEQQVA